MEVVTKDNEQRPKTVVEWVESVDYSNDDKYVPSEFALHFVNTIKLINGGQGESNKTPVLHYKMLDALATGSKDVLNMVFRGAAKTTVLGEYLFLYLAIYGGKLPNCKVPIDVGIYVSDSMENGVHNMARNLRYRWENSDFLQKYVPEATLTRDRWEFKNSSGFTLVIRGFGAKSGVRGFKEKGQRPKLAVLDDLVGDDDANSPTLIHAIENVVHKAVEFALDQQHAIRIWSGTPFNANDPLYKSTESGAWTVNVFPACEKFPCSREEFRGAWADRFDYDSLLRVYEKKLKEGQIASFNQELMLRIMSDEDRLLTEADIGWYYLADLAKYKHRYNYIITTDFATSKKSTADYTFISVWAVNNAGFKYWIDGVCKKQDLSEGVDDLFRLVSKYRPMSVGVETTGQQKGFISFIKREMIHRNVFFSLASDKSTESYGEEGIRPTADKLARFHVVVPEFKKKRMFFPYELEHTEALKELIAELRLVTKGGFKSRYDDGLDTISMLQYMPEVRPSEEDLSTPNDPIWNNSSSSEASALESYVY